MNWQLFFQVLATWFGLLLGVGLITWLAVSTNPLIVVGGFVVLCGLALATMVGMGI